MNLVALVGNVASKPERRVTEGGRSVTTFRLAVSRPNGTDADFFTVVTWEKQAEACGQYLGIGRRVAVEGRLQHSQWSKVLEPATEETEAVTQSRSKVEVVASRVDFIGPRPSTAPVALADRRPDGVGAGGVADDPYDDGGFGLLGAGIGGDFASMPQGEPFEPVAPGLDVEPVVV